MKTYQIAVVVNGDFEELLAFRSEEKAEGFAMGWLAGASKFSGDGSVIRLWKDDVAEDLSDLKPETRDVINSYVQLQNGATNG